MKNKNIPPKQAIRIKFDDNTTLTMWQKDTNIYIYIFASIGDNIDFNNIVACNIIDENMLCNNILTNLL